MECAYCKETILENQISTYMYFPDDAVFKKVHFYHLQAKGKKDDKK